MQTKINYIKAVFTDFIHRLKDVRFAGQVIFVIIVLLISWSGIKAINLNHSLLNQIATQKQQNIVQELKNNNLRLQNQYYESSQYQDLQARVNFGLGDPGEKEILVPRNVALDYAPKIRVNNSQKSRINISPIQQDITGWVNYFLHRT